LPQWFGHTGNDESPELAFRAFKHSTGAGLNAPCKRKGQDVSSFIRGKNTPPKYYLRGRLAGSLTAGYTIARCENRAWKRRAKACGKFVPACARIARKKMFITAGEKSTIVKYEKALRYADHLFPLRGQAAKDLRDKWFEASPNIAE
jgi:hypothetical protein